VWYSITSTALHSPVLRSIQLPRSVHASSISPEDWPAHGTATATFRLNLPDPGAGNTTTFTLTQMPSVSAVPEPETYAMLMAGLDVIGFMVRRRTAKQNV